MFSYIPRYQCRDQIRIAILTEFRLVLRSNKNFQQLFQGAMAEPTSAFHASFTPTQVSELELGLTGLAILQQHLLWPG